MKEGAEGTLTDLRRGGALGSGCPQELLKFVESRSDPDAVEWGETVHDSVAGKSAVGTGCETDGVEISPPSNVAVKSAVGAGSVGVGAAAGTPDWSGCSAVRVPGTPLPPLGGADEEDAGGNRHFSLFLPLPLPLPFPEAASFAFFLARLERLVRWLPLSPASPQLSHAWIRVSTLPRECGPAAPPAVTSLHLPAVNAW